MKVALVLNRSAGAFQLGRDPVSPAEIRAAFAAWSEVCVLHAPGPGELKGALHDACEHRPDVLIAGGGDGTLSTAAELLQARGMTLGVLPLGTLNHFARDLGLPRSWREAVAALRHGERRRVDLGVVNQRTFLNNCSIGSYAEAVRQREALRDRHGFGKWWAMALATLTVFRELRRLRAQVTTPAGPRLLRTPFVVVANNRYSGRVLDPSLRSRLDAGRLFIYTTRAGRRLTLLRLLLQSITRTIDAVSGLDCESATEADLVLLKRTAPLAIDGELVPLPPPWHFRCLPQALTVWAPPPIG